MNADVLNFLAGSVRERLEKELAAIGDDAGGLDAGRASLKSDLRRLLSAVATALETATELNTLEDVRNQTK